MQKFARVADLRAGIKGGEAGASLTKGQGASGLLEMSKAGGAWAVRGTRHAGGGGE